MRRHIPCKDFSHSQAMSAVTIHIYLLFAYCLPPVENRNCRYFGSRHSSVSLFSLVWSGIVEVLMCRDRARNSLGRVFVGQVSRPSCVYA